MKRKFIKFLIPAALGIWIFLFIFTHLTPERVIRANLFFNGYFLDAFRTEIQQHPITDSQYGVKYFCKNPAIGPDFYDIDYKNIGKLKFWYINWPGTGGG